MIAALAKSLGQLSDPPVLRVLWKSVALALLVMILLVVFLWILLGWLQIFDWGWLDTAVDFVAGIGAVIAAWLLFPVTVTAIVGFFLEDVAEAVDRRHYPHLPPARQQSIGEAVRSTLAFAAMALGLNLLLLPVYALLFFFPPAYLLLFYSVNGYLIGREYFEIVAFRRMPPAQAKALRKRHLGRIFAAGALIAFLLTIPLLNLLVPVIATLFMVHLFNSLPQTPDET
ncbi:MAG: EI24 domain-containing protein [Dongiaceae bacterium]